MKMSWKVAGAAMMGSALFLTACGSGGGQGQGGPDAGAAQSAGADISSLVSMNTQPRENLQDGGRVTLPVLNIGPDFNRNSQNGNSSANVLMLGVYNTAATQGCWTYQPDGTAVLNQDFCQSFDSSTEDGKQVITIKVNDQAVWNDGTPIAADAFINTWKMRNGEDPSINIVTPGLYGNIESVEQGATPKDVTVTMKQPSYPLADIFGTIINPNINTPEIFNNGLVGDPKPEWAAGPFKLENYDSSARTISFVPNENWWGTAPVLDQLVFRQMEDSASIAAFRNQEIDAVDGRTLNRYNQLQGSPNSEILRGQRLFAGGLNINPQQAPMDDVDVREAIWTAVDRQAIAAIRYQGLNWEETTPGSMMLMPFSQYYQDNWPVTESGPAAAKQVLTDVGYTEGSDGKMTKDGQPISFRITNFGDDPTGIALVQTLQQQLNDAGMDVSIDQRGNNEFGQVLGQRSFQLTISGYTVGSDATSAVKQYYDSQTGAVKTGDAELDQRIADLQGIADDAERNKAAMEVEKDHMAKYYTMGVLFNGPQIIFARTGLANYGASLFQDSGYVDWTLVGWQN
ncbi:ABC transporter family substrate-binding protein [Acaricomes phytoseiuli]|uniref:ABC transporter family substrate-binding protein n=1 Tax=Acaricomes phytoseiuli TaxID=291968 RepID=UPI00222291C5|nr:ABC transporter family substrate-binding protein [Acaricomes phytoseiuli]MCW1250541.1 ABC transporter family substrate-binding protein [Acaricomes phytoseiuli]